MNRVMDKAMMEIIDPMTTIEATIVGAHDVGYKV